LAALLGGSATRSGLVCNKLHTRDKELGMD